MEFIDYYKTLGLDKKSSVADIKAAYRKQARKYHPDVNPNDETAKKKFQEVNEANEVLSDIEKRKKYDTYGKDWQHAGEFEKQRNQQNRYTRNTYRPQGNTGFGGSDFSDFFESMFGGSGAGRGAQRFRGEDLNATLSLDLRDVFTTQKRTLTINNKNIGLTIPAGIENGQVIKITGHGGSGVNGGPQGDLFLSFNIKNNTPFKRDGSDLYTSVNIELIAAVLGAEITTDTFDGKVKLKVKPGTQNGTKVKLKGKGFPIYKKEGHSGDLYITYNILIPTELNAREKELFTELSKLK